MSITNTGAPLNIDQQRANRYMLAVQDMAEAAQYLETYRTIDSLLIAHSPVAIDCVRRGLLSAAIVAYCRPFLHSRSAGFATGSIGAADLKSVALRQALHDLLLKKRNTFVAHADWTERKAEVIISGKDSIHAAYSVPRLWDGLALDEFNILVRGVEQECMDKTLTHGLAAQAGPAVPT